MPFEAASKHTPHLQPSWGFPQLRPSARVAGHCAKFGTCQQCLLWPTSCLRQHFFLPSGRCSLWACGPSHFLKCFSSLFGRCSPWACGPGHFWKCFSSPSGRCSLWACGPGFLALRAFCLRRGTFCSPKKFLKNGSLRWPCGASRITSDPLRCFPQLACIGGGRGSAILKRETPQPCHLKPPRKICLAHNPPGAIRNSLEKYPSLATLLGLPSSAPISEGRGTLCEM